MCRKMSAHGRESPAHNRGRWEFVDAGEIEKSGEAANHTSSREKRKQILASTRGE